MRAARRSRSGSYKGSAIPSMPRSASLSTFNIPGSFVRIAPWNQPMTADARVVILPSGLINCMKHVLCARSRAARGHRRCHSVAAECARARAENIRCCSQAESQAQSQCGMIPHRCRMEAGSARPARHAGAAAGAARSEQARHAPGSPIPTASCSSSGLGGSPSGPEP